MDRLGGMNVNSVLETISVNLWNQGAVCGSSGTFGARLILCHASIESVVSVRSVGSCGSLIRATEKLSQNKPRVLCCAHERQDGWHGEKNIGSSALGAYALANAAINTHKKVALLSWVLPAIFFSFHVCNNAVV